MTTEDEIEKIIVSNEIGMTTSYKVGAILSLIREAREIDREWAGEFLRRYFLEVIDGTDKPDSAFIDEMQADIFKLPMW